VFLALGDVVDDREEKRPGPVQVRDWGREDPHRSDRPGRELVLEQELVAVLRRFTALPRHLLRRKLIDVLDRHGHQDVPLVSVELNGRRVGLLNCACLLVDEQHRGAVALEHHSEPALPAGEALLHGLSFGDVPEDPVDHAPVGEIYGGGVDFNGDGSALVGDDFNLGPVREGPHRAVFVEAPPKQRRVRLGPARGVEVSLVGPDDLLAGTPEQACGGRVGLHNLAGLRVGNQDGIGVCLEEGLVALPAGREITLAFPLGRHVGGDAQDADGLPFLVDRRRPEAHSSNPFLGVEQPKVSFPRFAGAGHVLQGRLHIGQIIGMNDFGKGLERLWVVPE